MENELEPVVIIFRASRKAVNRKARQERFKVYQHLRRMNPSSRANSYLLVGGTGQIKCHQMTCVARNK